MLDGAPDFLMTINLSITCKQSISNVMLPSRKRFKTYLERVTYKLMGLIYEGGPSSVDTSKQLEIH